MLSTTLIYGSVSLLCSITIYKEQCETCSYIGHTITLDGPVSGPTFERFPDVVNRTKIKLIHWVLNSSEGSSR